MTNRLTPNTWPQDTLQIPNANGRFMPPLDRANFDVARQEAFAFATTFTIPGLSAAGARFTNVIPTDQDGDFWCDQIFAIGWNSANSSSEPPVPATVFIDDLRTGRALTYPDGAPSSFFGNRANFSPGIALTGGRPLPNGPRSTATLAQPFCFTRQGGIRVSLQLVFATLNVPVTRTVDFVFAGWKEYTYASRGQAAGGA